MQKSDNHLDADMAVLLMMIRLLKVPHLYDLEIFKGITSNH